MNVLDRLRRRPRQPRLPKGPPYGTVEHGLWLVDQLGGPAGTTEARWVECMCANPVAIHEMPGGQRLLQWNTGVGTTNLQRVAVLFDATHHFVRITSRYRC